MYNMDTTLCNLTNPPTSNSQSQWDLMFEQSLEALCESLNVLGNIDSGIMRSYTGKSGQSRSPDTGQGRGGGGAGQSGCHGNVFESASIDSSGYLSSDSSTDTLVPSHNFGNFTSRRPVNVSNGNSLRRNGDSQRETGWTSLLQDHYNTSVQDGIKVMSLI
ncbi:hypothetical protein LSH36_416g02039 [Paralvinella palmiformis]|uniref:Uncharacterized protein n=1 Tax=Paralvinella palmiformis TaxID=53620 RepID=A0AAD9JCG5_9ANNE|nr:hypothetical protein LSH36_416g02039 [Paralvinella palmiformis]